MEQLKQSVMLLHWAESSWDEVLWLEEEEDPELDELSSSSSLFDVFLPLLEPSPFLPDDDEGGGPGGPLTKDLTLSDQVQIFCV